MDPAELRGILFDLDGVLYNSNRLIEGAVEAVDWVRRRQIPHLFVTNTTSRSRAVLAEKLKSFGFSVSESEILTPAVAAVDWLRTRDPAPIALFVPSSTRGEFAGLPCLPEEAERGAEFVIVGDLRKRWDFPTLNRAFRQLHYNPNALLIALGMTRYWLATDGISLDVAPFVAALECASGRKAIAFGKPSEAFFHGGTDRLALPAGQVLMIGDDIHVDVGGAQAAGLKGALVRTGKFRPDDLEGSVKPFAVLDSVASLPDWWEKNWGKP